MQWFRVLAFVAVLATGMACSLLAAPTLDLEVEVQEECRAYYDCSNEPIVSLGDDTGIEVYATQECGYQFSASTNWASGVDGIDGLYYILIDDEPITKKWCLNPDEAKLMEFPQSWMYQQILDDIIAACEARALEMALGQDNCREMATVTYSGTCPGEHEWCEAEDTNDEVGIPDMPTR